MTFAELVKEKDMSLARLARKLGTSKESVGNWAHGKFAPSSLLIPKIAKALETDNDTVIECLQETAERL